MQRDDFLQKPAELAQSTQSSIEKLWKMGAEVSKLYAPLTSIFSSLFAVLCSAILKESGFSKAIYDFTLTRFDLLYPYDPWMERNARPEAEYFATETVRPTISFLLNFSVARRLVSNLGAQSVQPHSKSTLFSTGAALLGPETPEVFKKPSEETPEKNLFHRIAGLQNELESKLARSMKSMSSAFAERERQTIPLTSFAALVEPRLPVLTSLENVASYRFANPLEKETFNAGLPRHPKTEGSRSPPPSKKTTTEMASLELAPSLSLNFEALESFGYAARLPTVISKQQTPMTVEAAPPELASSARIRAGVSTAVNNATELLAIISERQKPFLKLSTILSRALPISARSVPRTHDITTIERGLTTPKFKTGVRHEGAEDFGLPSNLTSIVASYVRTYPVLFTKPRIGEIYEKSFEAGSIPLGQPATPSETWKEKEFYGLPIMLALAARSKNLINPRLQHKLADFIEETQIAQSTTVGAIIELSTGMPVRATMLGELATGAAPSYTIENYVSRTPQALSSEYRPRPVTPIIENAINLSLSEETLEDDLRDLERKISRILSEQLSRYYGSSRIQGG